MGHETDDHKKKYFFELVSGNRGREVLDLCTTTNTELTTEMGVQTLPTGVFGPLPVETWGFLLGRSSSIVKGLQVYPGVIDNGYEGEIKILAASPHGIIAVPTNQRIAQLVLVPLYLLPSRFIKNKRGQSGFGSSDVY